MRLSSFALKSAFSVFLILFLFACPAFSQECGDCAEGKSDCGEVKDDCCPDLTVIGYAQATYSGNLGTKVDRFALDEASVAVWRHIGKKGIVFVQPNWYRDGANGWDSEISEAYLGYVLPCRLTYVNFTLGKMTAPIGLEARDPDDMMQYSHSLLYTYGTPEYLTGAKFDIGLPMGLDLQFYLSNGMDMNYENNGSKTMGGRLGFRMPGMAKLGFSYLSGSEDIDQKTVISIMDIDATITPMPALTVGVEYNMGNFDNGAATDNEFAWSGFLVKANYMFCKSAGLTFRYDNLADDDDHIFGSGLKETRSSITVAPIMYLGKGMRAMIEYRMDSSSEKVFDPIEDGEKKDSEYQITFEMLYTF